MTGERRPSAEGSDAATTRVELGGRVLRFRPGSPLVMGVVNATPDSFSDGGELPDAGAAVRRALALLDDGASIVDIGGESTRPGAAPVAIDEEIRRVAPVVAALRRERPDSILSIDTRNAPVAEEAARLGADLVNDVTGATHDPAILDVAARHGMSIVLGHILGTPETMQSAPAYVDVVGEVREFLRARVEAARRAGIPSSRILVDPGIGFGKNLEHNLALVRNLTLFADLAGGVVVGLSRKRFLGTLTGREFPKERLAASLAAALSAADRGVAILRVHDVRETVDALAVRSAIEAPG